MAKDFVASLFDVKRQSRRVPEGGIPVNEKALLMWKRTSFNGGAVNYISKEDTTERIPFNGMTEDDADHFINYVKALDHPAYNDEDYWTIFADEGCGYLEGKKTLDQAVDDIINRYNLYLDESR